MCSSLVADTEAGRDQGADVAAWRGRKLDYPCSAAPAAGGLRRRDRITIVRPVRQPEVEIRSLADYDLALGTGSAGGTVA
jgi:hypothetical protein